MLSSSIRPQMTLYVWTNWTGDGKKYDIAMSTCTGTPSVQQGGTNKRPPSPQAGPRPTSNLRDLVPARYRANAGQHRHGTQPTLNVCWEPSAINHARVQWNLSYFFRSSIDIPCKRCSSLGVGGVVDGGMVCRGWSSYSHGEIIHLCSSIFLLLSFSSCDSLSSSWAIRAF